MSGGADETRDLLFRRLLWVLVPAALVVTALVVRREVTARANDSASRLPRRVAEWRELARDGHRIGSDSAKVTIIEFADFECGHCVRFSDRFAIWRERYGDDVALVFRHFPLEHNRYAFATAVAAECAAAQGRFEAMHNGLFAARARFDGRTMVSFAVAAGVPDTAAFAACLHSEAMAARVRRDRDYIARLGAPGTPTLIINGEVILGVPDDLQETLEHHLRAARRG